MLRQVNFFLCLVALAATVGCGKVDTKKRQDPKVVEPNIIGKIAPFSTQYFLEDPSCENTLTMTRLSSVPVYHWQGNSVRQVRFTFNDLISSNTISSEIIESTSYNYHQRTECSKSNGSLRCNKTPQIVSKAKFLRLCRANGDYQRQSYEGVALSTIANIDQAYKFYSLMRKGLPAVTAASRPRMQRLQLLVLPKVEKVYSVTRNGRLQMESLISSNNLSYISKFLGKPTLVTYPRTTMNKTQLWNGLNLWEIPWAVAHEFGHHVFMTHAKIVADASLKHSDTVDLFTQTGRGGAQANRQSTVVSINEAFADLFAYYSLAAKPGLTNNLDCFAKNRDVSSVNFADGQKKALSLKVLNEFYSQTPTSQKSCEQPWFQDPHAIGAIVAYGLDRFYSATVGGDHGEKPALEKSIMLTSWLENLALKFRFFNSSIDLKGMVFLAIAAESRSNQNLPNSLSRDQCNAVKETFPIFMNEWLNRGMLRCAG